jgi:hypothetical protein
MTSITRVIKDLIDANTIAKIQEDLANGSATVGITNVIYTDENFANTANDYIANTSSHGYIKVLGYGFLPNANVVLSLVNEITNNEVLLEHSNTYYVNFKELRVKIENSNDLSYDIISLKSNSYFANSLFNLFVINENGTNSKKDFSVKLERKYVVNNYGWFAGGIPNTSIIDRIDFSADTGTASVRGVLSAIKYRLSAAGNNDYGWFGGGSSTSTVDRLTFRNDTSKLSERGTLSTIKVAAGATGNDDFGWFGAGNRATPSVVRLSTVDRIDFADDTGTASVRGPLSLVRDQLAATGNNNYGWFAGGRNPPSGFSTVDRIDFVDDTVTASVRGPLSLARFALSATGNDNYGWFNGASPSSSTVDRIDFADDTVTASVRGPLSANRGYSASTGNDNFGWFAGGFPALSSVDRIDFADDTVTSSNRGVLSVGRRDLTATSGLS